MTERLPCLVPGCKRTTKFRGCDVQWLCQIHWTMTNKRLRRRFFRARRRGKERGWTQERIRRCDVLWKMLVEQAIERAVGL